MGIAHKQAMGSLPVDHSFLTQNTSRNHNQRPYQLVPPPLNQHQTTYQSTFLRDLLLSSSQLSNYNSSSTPRGTILHFSTLLLEMAARPTFFPTADTKGLAPDHEIRPNFGNTTPTKRSLSSINEYLCYRIAEASYMDSVADSFNSPKQHLGSTCIQKLEKELGKGVFLRDEMGVMVDAVGEAVGALYRVNRTLGDKLLATGNQQLVYASPADDVLGIGFDACDGWQVTSGEGMRSGRL